MLAVEIVKRSRYSNNRIIKHSIKGVNGPTLHVSPANLPSLAVTELNRVLQLQWCNGRWAHMHMHICMQVIIYLKLMTAYPIL